MASDIVNVAQNVITYGTNYTGEVYTANTSTKSTNPVSVQLKKYNYGTSTPVTAWKTCAQVDTDGCPTPIGGTYKPTTSLSDGSGHYVNADTVPYIVLPSNNNNNVSLGDVGIVVDVSTGNFVYVIYADRGPNGVIGEASIAVHKALGYQWISNGTLIGHDKLDLVYIMFPGSGASCGFGQGKAIPTASQISANAAPYFSGLLGYMTQI